MKLKRKYLKEEEILTINLNNSKMKEQDYLIAQEQLKQQILKVNIEKLELQIEKISNNIASILRDKDNIKTKNKAYTDKVKKACGVKEDKWGFNPESGEITL